MTHLEKMKYLVDKLNEYRDAYYNRNDSIVTDEVYDKLFDELKYLEKVTGVILSNSPTNTVGFKPISELPTVKHPILLLSLDKETSYDGVIRFKKDKKMTAMHKLDGLTVRLDYENGELVLAATRGDGNEGDEITHNIPAFIDVPKTIPFKERLSVCGEAYIYTFDFDRLNAALPEDKRFSTVRNLTAGTVRAFDPKICQSRSVRFSAFKVLEGMDDINSKSEQLDRLSDYGFHICERFDIPDDITADELEEMFVGIKNDCVLRGIPIDGVVVQYDDIEYSKSCGKTGHHYKDGLAFKFEDERVETRLKEIEWTTSRSGCIAPVGIFDTIKLDGCDVSRATLHNISFIKKLNLNIGNRIKVSKRHMIIPAIEENIDMDGKLVKIPERCPQCGAPTVIKLTKNNKTGQEVERLFCTNKECGSSIIKRFVHFADKDSMDIEGLAEGTIIKLLENNFVTDFADLYELAKHKDEIIHMEGFGEKSYEKLIGAIEVSSYVTLNKFLRAVDIPLLGRHASKTISNHFGGDISAFEDAVFGDEPFDFRTLEGIGEVLHQNIYEWFYDDENLSLWRKLTDKLTFIQPELDEGKETDGMLKGKTVVVTGVVEGYTRSEADELVTKNGGTAASSVTKNTDILVIGEKPGGSKLKKAEALGTKTMTADEFKKMLGIN